MKNKWKWVAGILLCLTLTGCGANLGSGGISTAVSQNKEQTKDNVKDSVSLFGTGLNVRVKYGMNGSVKYNRYMKVSAEVDNHGNDFSGWLQIVVPTKDEDQMYQKQFSVKAGEEKTVSMAFPACMGEDQMLISINDNGGESVCSKQVEVNLIYGTDTVFVGVYSNRPKKMGYLDGPSSDVFYLSRQDFVSDCKTLDTLDIIVISDKDISSFSEMQTKALMTWVKRGGTLVLADSGKEKELSAFDGEFFSWNVEGKKKITTSLGLDLSDIGVIQQRLIQGIEEEKAEKVREFLSVNLSRTLYDSWKIEIANIRENSYCLDKSEEIFTYLLEKYSEEELKQHLSLSVTEEERKKILSKIEIPYIERKLTQIAVEGGEPLIYSEGRDVILQKKSQGLGEVILSGCSLALERKKWDVLGNEILERIIKNIPDYKKQQLQAEKVDAGTEEYVYEQGLLITDTDNLPNLKLYGGILIAYAFLVGPVFYLIFRKKEKLAMLWGMIPATAILFSVFIYLLGTSTRIHEPYMNYLSHIQLTENDQAIRTIWFRLINGQNENYEMVLDGNRDVEPFTFASAYDLQEETGKKIKREYQYGIEYGNTQTKITMENLSAFEGKNFKEQDVIKEDGGIRTDIESENMKLTGSVTNQFDYTLEDCFLFDSGTVYFLGDIESGQAVSLENLDSDQIYFQSEYNYDYTELIKKLFGVHLWFSDNSTDCVKRRRAVLADGFLEKEQGSGCTFFGFASDCGQIDDVFDYDHYGEISISKKIDIKYTSNGMEVLPDMSKYAVSFDSDITDGKAILDPTKERIAISYQLPKGYQWKGLVYNQNNNAEFSYYSNGYLSSPMYSGTVTMIAPSTGQEITILESGREMNMELPPESISDDGILTLYYYLDTSVDADLQLPNIMVYVTK